jgi:excinuclease ABC subunit C
MTSLADKVRELPTEPGVYLFLDAIGRVLYVGKATSLRARVRSYFQEGGDGRVRLATLADEAKEVEVLLTGSAREALILENTLIKKHRPRYNVRLRDDKAYLCVRIDTAHRFPRIHVVRRFKKDGARYFGPFADSKAVRETLRTIQRTFGLRVCSDRTLETRDRPCLFHQVGRCEAPCVGRIDEEGYAAQVHGAMELLRGRRRDVAKAMREAMLAASEALEFERAATMRDRLRALERTVEGQAVVSADLGDRDVVGMKREGQDVLFEVLFVREGAVVSARDHLVRAPTGDAEALTNFLVQFYGRGKWVPAEILVPVPPADRELVEEVLSGVRGARVRVAVPLRGPKRDVLDLAGKNAAASFGARRDRRAAEIAAVAALGRRLELEGPPLRIECFDISNFQGRDSVASMVAFEEGRPDRDRYRHFRIKTVEGADDFASMAEVLGRRYRAGLQADPPDLIVVDGGRGQLGSAREALRERGLEGCAVVGLAKARPGRPGEKAFERVFLPDRRAAVVLDPADAETRLIQRIRDEAHRFAITYHRKVRKRRTLGSPLEDVPGVGPKRRKALLDRFGGLEGIRKATAEELAEVPGIPPALAEDIARHVREE